MSVLIARLPTGKPWAWSRSACPHCQHRLSPLDLIPVVSALWLRFRCRYCQRAFSKFYLGLELLMCSLAAWLLWSSSGQYGWIIFQLLFLGALIVHFVIDYQHQILPDEINIFLVLLAIIKYFYFQQQVISLTWQEVLTAGAVGFGSTLLVTYLFYWWRGVIGLGGGDIKLFGVIGLFLGTIGFFKTLMLSSFIGIAWALVLMSLKKLTKDQPFCFGPSIIIAFLVYWFQLIPLN